MNKRFSLVAALAFCSLLFPMSNTAFANGLAVNSDGSVSIGTQADVDNIRIDGNTISSTNANGNIIFSPNGSGSVVFGSPLNAASGGTGISSFTAGDILYATGAATFSKLAKGSANQKLFMNASGTAPQWDKGTNAITFKRYMNSPSGSVSYTGVGFKPSLVIFLSQAGLSDRLCVGFDKQTSRSCMGSTSSDTESIYVSDTERNATQKAYITSMNSDGFTLYWTKSSISTRYAKVIAICFR